MNIENEKALDKVFLLELKGLLYLLRVVVAYRYLFNLLQYNWVSSIYLKTVWLLVIPLICVGSPNNTHVLTSIDLSADYIIITRMNRDNKCSML